MTLVDVSSNRPAAVALAGILTLALSAACGGTDQQVDPVNPAPAPSSETASATCDEPASAPTADDGEELVDSSVLISWHEAAFKAAFDTAKNGFVGLENQRGWTMMHIAVHDALNAIRPVYGQYAFTGCQPDAHPTVATAQAAHDVLIEVYPTLKDRFDDQLKEQLGAIAEGKGKETGIALGKSSAAAILAARKDDGMLVDAQYEARPARPGAYQVVKPLAFVYKPTLGDARPFAVKSGKDMLPPPPPAPDSAEYATAYNEVKKLGGKKSKARSAEQTRYAAWWAEFGDVTWNRAASIIARERNVDLYTAARMFALLNIGLADAYIVTWNAKRHHDAWRPVTAIHAAAKDGNDATRPDKKWESLLMCPPIQEYPSASAVQASVSASILASVLGSDDVPFSMETVTAPPDGKERSFKKLSDAAAEAADARVMAGIHFRYSTDTGSEMGKQIATAVVEQKLTPRAAR
jgi:hypothetical protein